MAVAEVLYLLTIFVIVAVALVFTSWLMRWVMARDEGAEAMRAVALAIREGADSFLKGWACARALSPPLFFLASLIFFLPSFLFIFQSLPIPPHAESAPS